MKAALAHLSLTAREELKGDNITVSVLYPYITDTDFDKNTFKSSPQQNWENSETEEEAWAKADPPELVAKQILEAIEKGTAEIVAHDWMK